MIHTCVFKVPGAHWGSKEADIRHAISELCPQVGISFNPEELVVTTSESQNLDPAKVTEALQKEGFKVSEVNQKPFRRRSSALSRVLPLSKSSRRSSRTQLFNQYRDRAGTSGDGTSGGGSDSKDKVEYRAVYSIQGMSCAGCAQGINTSVKEAMPDITDIKVDVMSQSASLLIKNSYLAEKVQKTIRDAGYGCQLRELLPITTAVLYKVQASIGGMTCSSCSNAVKTATSALDFVHSVSVDVLTGSAVFQVTNDSDVPALKEAVEDCGYTFTLVDVQPEKVVDLQKQSRTVNLKVSGMYCKSCPEWVMEVLQSYGDAVEIVDGVTLDHPYVKFTYVPDAPRFTIRQIINRILSENPQLEISFVLPQSLEELAAEHLEVEKSEILVRLVLTAVIAVPMLYFMLTMATHHSRGRNIAMLVLATPVYLFADDIFHRKALKEIKNLWQRGSWRKDLFHFGSMSLLMSLGTSISFWSSVFLLLRDGMAETYFDSVVFLTLFLLVGRYLDVYSKAKTSSAMSSLSDLCPNDVSLLNSDGTVSVQPVSAVEVHDNVRVMSGQKAAVDGIVIKGDSTFDESMLTGESLPVSKSVGSQVFAGTTNVGSGAVTVQVTAVDKNTLLDGITSAVRDGQMTSAPIERVAEQITGVFVPVVVYLALGVWLLWYVLGKSGYLPKSYLDSGRGNSWGIWSMEFAISVFVVACPCGIGLAAPSALFVGSRMAAKYGILARGGGEAFQEGAAVDIVCFDKTGTITHGGELKITGVWFAKNSHEHQELEQLAARMEADSVHPLAKAVSDYASGAVLESRVEDIEQVPGRGVRAQISAGPYAGRRCLLGNERLMEESRVQGGDPSVLDEWKSSGKSVILLAIDDEVVMMLAASDEIRPEAAPVIAALQSRGIECWMITGDNEKTAHAVAAQVGIAESNVISEVLPEEKAERVRWLQATGNAGRSKTGRAIVAFVGDGVNDAPSLSVCDVGIAIGSGADVALQCAKFILVRSDLWGVLTVFDFSRAVMRRVKLNFFWAAIYNIVMVPIAAGVLFPWTHQRLDPVWASLAMALSSVSVVGSSLALRWLKPPREAA